MKTRETRIKLWPFGSRLVSVLVLLSALPWATWRYGWRSELASEWLSVRSKRESKFAQTTKKWAVVCCVFVVVGKFE
jgi:hypothetical protein